MFKINIYRKIVLTILVVSIAPLIFLGFVTFNNFNILNDKIYFLFYQLSKDVSGTATADMEDLGEMFIREKAVDVAEQVRLFLSDKSDLSIEELQKEEDLVSAALSKVGETGYCCLYECKTGIMRIHPNPNLIDKDMSFLKDDLPTWWNIFEPSLNCEEISGYYDWKESDGSIRKKYMTMTPVKGTSYMIAATTYIDEFSKPVTVLNKKISERTNFINTQVEDLLKNQKNMIITSIIITLLLVIIVSLLFSRMIISPILKLKNASKMVSSGNMNIKVDIEREDEIGELADYFNIMIDSLKKTQKELKEYSEQLEGRVEKRTHELQEKLEELEKFNELAVDRELKMVKLKNEIENLKNKLK